MEGSPHPDSPPARPESQALVQGGVPVVLAATALDILMPLHLRLDARGHMIGAGPTMRKLLGDGWLDRHLTAVFDLRRPRRMINAADLIHATRLGLALRTGARTGFKGVAVPISDAGSDRCAGWAAGSASPVAPEPASGDGAGPALNPALQASPDRPPPSGARPAGRAAERVCDHRSGVLLNLSFGPSVADAVRDHGLSDTDFAPTDLAIELLFLAEARAAVMAEVDRMTDRLRRARSVAEEQANTDALTGLNNRRAMDRRLAALIAAGTPFALMHLDLDFFKSVNDTHGHAAGDRLLAMFAGILRQSVRDGDTVARVGGDEFILLLTQMTDAGELARLGQRLLDRLADRLIAEGLPGRVSTSIGAVLSSSYPHPEPDVMLSDADQALYRSKHAGRGCMTLDMGPGGDRFIRPTRMPVA